MIRVFTGKNELALEGELRKIVAEFKKDVGDFGIEKIDASETEAVDVLQAVQSLPFLAPKKLVIITHPQENKQLLEQTESLYERTADQVEVVIIGSKIDKRSTAWKFLKKQADVQDFPELKAFELPKWVVSHANTLGLEIRQADAAYLVDRVGANQQILTRELEKLALGATGVVGRDVINELTEPTPQSTVFDLLEAAFTGKRNRAVELYREQRRQRVEPQYIIAMLAWQLQGLALTVCAQPAAEQTLVGAGQTPYSARKSLGLAKAKRLNAQQVARYIQDLIDTDTAIKTSAEPDAALELYILGL